MVHRDRAAEFFATIRGGIGLFLVYGLGFIILGVIAYHAFQLNGWHEPFKLGNVPIPTYQGAGATNFQIFTMCVAGLVAIGAAVVSRYFYYREVIESLRELGIDDYDRDGQVDSFADDFLDEDFL
ncbi:MAG: hypothetical protein AAF431_12365 [Pseudomonadota bacterium]